jgi:protein O-GlcNAc transferase
MSAHLDAESLVQLARNEFEAGRYQNAVNWLEQARTQAPGDVTILVNLGTGFQRMGYLREATACLESACQQHPNFGLAWAQLGDVLRQSGQTDRALKALNLACDLAPALAAPRIAIALMLQGLGRVTEAQDALRQAVSMEPGQADAWCNLALVLQDMGLISESLQATRYALFLSPNHTMAQSNLLMGLQYDVESDAKSLKLAAFDWGKAIQPAAQPLKPKRSLKSKIRVGYVSGDFSEHPVGWLSLEVLRCHDREEFDIFCYANQAGADALTQEIMSLTVNWRYVLHLTDEALGGLIAQDEIDVLIDLAGHTAGNRLRVFAGRCAPVQLSWLGYFASTGLSQIDGVVISADQVPKHADSFFVETLCRMGRVHFCYAPPKYSPPIRLRGVDSKSEFVFGSFNNLAKLNDGVVRLWAQLLREIPNSRLILKSKPLADPHFRDVIRQRFVNLGCKPRQIELRGASIHSLMLNEYGDIDVALDPFPFSGGLTTCEALWMGVPVVTCPSERPVSRQSMVILNELNLHALVAESSVIYVDICRQLAENRAGLQSLRQTMRARMLASRLMNGIDLARELEGLYRKKLFGRAMRSEVKT